MELLLIISLVSRTFVINVYEIYQKYYETNKQLSENIMDQGEQFLFSLFSLKHKT